MSGMREALRQLSSESLVYGLGQVSGRAVQLLLVPVLTRALLQAEYGVSDLVFAYLQTAVLVLVFGMDGALARFFYQEPDRAARVRMASSSLLFRLATGAAAALLLALFAAPLAEGLAGSASYRGYVRIVAATLPCTLVVLFGNDVLRVTFQPWKFIALNLVQTLLTAGLSLWLVLGEGMGVAGVLYGRLGGDAASALVALVLVRHTLAPRFSGATLRRMLAYGAPLVPVALAYGAIASVDRFVLQRACGLADVAVYGVAVKFFALVTMYIFAVNFKKWGLPYLPTVGMFEPEVGQTPAQVAWHMILPVATLSFGFIAGYQTRHHGKPTGRHGAHGHVKTAHVAASGHGGPRYQTGFHPEGSLEGRRCPDCPKF